MKKKPNIFLIIVMIIFLGLGVSFYAFDGMKYVKDFIGETGILQKEKTYKAFVKSDKNKVILKDMEFNDSDEIIRGTEVVLYEYNVTDEENNIIYNHIKHNKKDYLILSENLTNDYNDVINISKMFVRTPSSIYKDSESIDIIDLAGKGQELTVLGFDKIDENGYPVKLHIKKGEAEGYVYYKYLSNDKDLSLKNYNDNGKLWIHEQRGDTLGGGDGAGLDYYPVIKPSFENNKIPTEARTLYLNVDALGNLDEYIKLAKASNINAFVVDIKENTTIGYKSNVMKEYSPTTYNNGAYSMEDYKKKIDKIKESGIYAIGRIVTFKDDFLVADHNEVSIKSNWNGQPFMHQGSYWPTAFNRYVWIYNTKLAVEAVKEIGFNEIQFDYVRFPDGTWYAESSGQIDLQNAYGESKAQAIQRFLMYACDEIHNAGAYCSADVFGESAYTYVTAYGQYWPAISNVVDAISGMPYPDHFNKYDFGSSEVVWTVPYFTLNTWGRYAAARQTEIPTPAIVRTWIQAYDAIREPYIIYDASKVSDQIRGLYDNGLRGGFITWNGKSNIDKYWYISEAFKGEY